MKVRYWVRISEERKARRVFEITDSARIQDAFAKFKAKRIEGYSIGVTEQLLLKTHDGETWNCNIVFEDRFDFGLKSDPWRAYNVFLASDAFYEWLREVCLKHEQRTNPHAKAAHIILQSNIPPLDAYPVLRNLRDPEKEE